MREKKKAKSQATGRARNAELAGSRESDYEERKGPKGTFHIVGIGASAGGLEAFEQFFAAMPPDSGMAFVLIPHLSPEHKSLMPELLRRYTSMEIFEAQEGMEVRQNRIYIIPPNKDMSIAGGRLRLEKPVEERGVRHPIDYFFRSLAQDQGDRAICIILSGTGKEGAIGLRSIKGEGGLVLAQDIHDAKYEGMPSGAIATGLVDHVLPAGNMPEVLLRYAKLAQEGPAEAPAPRAQEGQTESLQRIYGLIRAQTGHDFSLYKQNTVLRRINKRLAIHQIDSLNDYITYLRSNPHEIEILFNELLIRVTSFFRDAEAFTSLATNALPLVFGNKLEDSPVRIWVPGSSTGEEAYSLAILCHEFLRERPGARQKIQIFATDIDTGAIDIARAGVYPDTIGVDVAPGLLSRYFVKRGSSYRIREEIRERVVFAAQDLIKDPPFSKLDLIVCRNVLIYMGLPLQKRVIALFHYSLLPEGILFLGSSETVGEASDLFTPVDKKWKIYRGRRVEVLPVAALDLRQPIAIGAKRPPTAAPEGKMLPGQPIGDFIEQQLLDDFSPPCVAVNEKGDILFFHGKTGKYLEPAAGKAALNIVEMAREGLRLEVRTGLRKALSQKKEITYEGLQVTTNGGKTTVNLTLKYIEKPRNLEGLVLIVFQDVPTPPPEKAAKTRARERQRTSERLTALETELKSTREHLQTTIEELETSNEELKSTNEELQSSNEELQSTNEELETSREELQSANEELLTVNTELQRKIEELSEANSDIVSLLASTQIATIFLNYDLRIRRYTPMSAEVINIIQTDVGRPISDISTKIDYPELVADAEEVLRSLASKERTVKRQDGRWFLARIVPYRTMDNVIGGVVLTFVDITDQKRALAMEQTLIGALRAMADTIRLPLLVLNAELRILAANSSFASKFRTGAGDVENRPIFEIIDGGLDIPALRELLSDALNKDLAIQDYLIDREFPRIGQKKFRINARRIVPQGLAPDALLLALEEVSGDSP